MAVTYPVDAANTKWSVLQLSTGEIIARNVTWPRSDGAAIDGLNPDYVYLLQLRETPPDYDSRYYRLVSTETVDADSNEIRVTFTTEKRSVEEQTEAAENEEAARLSLLIKVERELIETRLMLGAVLMYTVEGQQLPTKVRTMKDEYVAKAVKVYQNRDRLQEILADIANGLEPDLDAGWTES